MKCHGPGIGVLLGSAVAGCGAEDDRALRSSAPPSSSSAGAVPAPSSETERPARRLTLLAWSFRSRLSTREMLAKLNEAASTPWVEGDGERHDYLAGQLTKHGVARIYRSGDHYVVNLRFVSEDADAPAQLAESKRILLADVLPKVGAEQVEPSEPFE